MDTRTGRIYPSVAAALAAGVPDEALITGPLKALQTVRRKMRVRHPARNAAGKRAARRRIQKLSRRRNRG